MEKTRLNQTARLFFKHDFFWITLALAFLSSGCSGKINELDVLNRQQAATIQSLNNEIGRLNSELESLLQSRQELLKTKDELEKKLQEELASGNLSVSVEERGLVVTVLDQILFDSGKAELKPSSLATLNKVGETLKQRVSRNRVSIEGHTDNVPIHYSGWRSNWELSTARATEVIHYFIDERKLNPRRFGATGHGQFQPLADNKTAEGRFKNRRVEIVISPKKISV